MILFTIGSGQKSAEKFFSLLKQNKVQRLIDIRLNNKSQLAGFTKNPDLQYFLKQIAAIDYIHLPILAPTQVLLAGYREKKVDWTEYERSFGELMNQRNPLAELNADIFDSACLLCSEPTAKYCHRRLVAEYLAKSIPALKIQHL